MLMRETKRAFVLYGKARDGKLLARDACSVCPAQFNCCDDARSSRRSKLFGMSQLLAVWSDLNLMPLRARLNYSLVGYEFTSLCQRFDLCDSVPTCRLHESFFHLSR